MYFHFKHYIKKILEYGSANKSVNELVKQCTSGLLSRDGQEGMARFTEHLRQVAPDFLAAWSHPEDMCGLNRAVHGLLQALDHSMVDVQYPVCREGGLYKNTFALVRLLLSLAEYCAPRMNPCELLQGLANQEPDCLCFTVAHARTLLAAGRWREAADVALAARALDVLDYCARRAVNDTQAALLREGLEPDMLLPGKPLPGRFCHYPFTTRLYGLTYAGREHFAVSSCACPGWMPIGLEKNMDWNGEDMQEIRKSILDGSFRYCDESMCKFLLTNTLPTKEAVSNPVLRACIDQNLTFLPTGPQTLVFGHDISCNLTCPSCRDKIMMADAKTVTALNAKMDMELAAYLPGVKNILLSQAGEALASPHCLHILKALTPEAHRHIKVTLLTNCSLVSAATWEKLGPAAKNIQSLVMSIDGGRQETLEKLRRGLKWPRLLEALDFVRSLRASGQLEETRIAFLLQKDNYRELQDILRLASEFCVDVLVITSPMTPGSYDAQAFRDLDVCSIHHPLHVACRAEVQQLKETQAQMLQEKEAIEASGRTVPKIVWRCFQDVVATSDLHNAPSDKLEGERAHA